jgi:hypothetical protein
MNIAATLGMGLGAAGTAAGIFGRNRMVSQMGQIAQQEINDLEMELGARESNRQRAMDKLLGVQRTRFAKAGVTMEGTPTQVQADTAAEFGRETEADYARTRATQQVTAQNARNQASNARWANLGAVAGFGSALLLRAT